MIESDDMITNIYFGKDIINISIILAKNPSGPQIEKISNTNFVIKIPDNRNKNANKGLAAIRRTISFLIYDLIIHNNFNINSIYINNVTFCGLSGLFLANEFSVPLFSALSRYDIEIGFYNDHDFSILNQVADTSNYIIINEDSLVKSIILTKKEYNNKIIKVNDLFLDKEDIIRIDSYSKKISRKVPWKRKNDHIIFVSNPFISGDEIEYVNEVIKSKWWGYGPVSKYLESKIENYLGNGYNALATSNCTASIHLALSLLNIKKGDEVILPSMTFISTLAPIIYLGATPKFADINCDTLGINLKSVESLITSKTKAILPVHYAGVPSDLDGLQKLTNNKSITIVEDAAHALGSYYKNKKIGSISKFTCFSFAPTKSLASNYGGILVYKYKNYKTKLLSISEMGLKLDTLRRTNHIGLKPENKIIDIGYRYRLNDISAAIAIAQFNKMENILNYKNELVNRYYYNLSQIEGITLIRIPIFAKPAWYIMPIRVRKSIRNKLRNYLFKKGFDTSIHYPLLPLQKPFVRYKSEHEVAFNEYNKLITLPLHNNLSFNQIDQISDIIEKFIKIS